MLHAVQRGLNWTLVRMILHLRPQMATICELYSQPLFCMEVCKLVIYVWSYSWGNIEDIPAGFHKTAVIDNATSIIWVKRFNDCGEFEIYIPASEKLLNLFGGEVILTRDDSDAIMWVEKVKLTTDEENGDFLTISGRSAECVLARRIVNKQTILRGTAENAIRRLLEENLINPSDILRQIDFVKLEKVNGFTEKIEKQITGDDLLTAVSEISKTYNYGFKIQMDNEKNFVFGIYRGKDRSFEQLENTHVVFSTEFENLGNTEYEQDRSNTANYMYVAGEGEGTARKVEKVSNLIEGGLYVREKWVDAAGISSNNGEISETDYKNLLIAKGNEQLEEMKPAINFSGELLNVNNYIYGVDYNLGDKITVVNNYGIQGNATITTITEVEDENGYKIYPSLSEWRV